MPESPKRIRFLSGGVTNDFVPNPTFKLPGMSPGPVSFGGKASDVIAIPESLGANTCQNMLNVGDITLE
jgi:hypothetical protein